MNSYHQLFDPSELSQVDVDLLFANSIGEDLITEFDDSGSSNVPSLPSPIVPESQMFSEEFYANIIGQENEKPTFSSNQLPPVEAHDLDYQQYIPEQSQSLVELVSAPLNDSTGLNESVGLDSSGGESVDVASSVTTSVLLETPKKRNSRKSSHIMRSEGAVYDQFQIKTEPEEAVADPALRVVVGTKRQRNKSSRSVSCNSDGEKKDKKPKMYELDDPKAKNAKAAFVNRQKKKEAMEGMKKRNDELSQENQRIKEDLEKQQKIEEELRQQLEYEQRKNRAESGLQRVVTSARDVIVSALPGLNKRFGQFQVEVAPWFNKVDASIKSTGTVDESLGGPMMTSKFITLHINPVDRICLLDYRPDDPILPQDIPRE